MTTFDYVLCFLSKHMQRESGQCGDKSSGNMLGIQNLRLQTAYKKFPLEAVAKELWKRVMHLNEILVASCSIYYLAVSATACPTSQPLYMQQLCVSGALGNERGEECCVGHEDGQKGEGSQLLRKNNWDTNSFPQNQPKKGDRSTTSFLDIYLKETCAFVYWDINRNVNISIIYNCFKLKTTQIFINL